MAQSISSTVQWSQLTDDELLEYRFSDLNLQIKGTPLEKFINRLYQELDQKQLQFHPLCYLGDEWFSPDNGATVSIPFYLAHPRLMQLEKKIMLEVEGGSEKDCMKLLRHETGHAICHAFGLHKKKQWQTLFGSPKQDFSDFYYYQPYSKRFVHHLDNWYAQSHPEEDFAETFALWLTPDLDWQKLYHGWPALSKLNYVDKLMKTLQSKQPSTLERGTPYAVKKMQKKLKTHYKQRRNFFAEDDPAFFDTDLYHLFSQSDDPQKGLRASRFLKIQKKRLLNIIPHWTHERKFTVNRLIKKLSDRCDTLQLYASNDQEEMLMTVSAYLTALTSTYLFTGKFKVHS